MMRIKRSLVLEGINMNLSNFIVLFSHMLKTWGFRVDVELLQTMLNCCFMSIYTILLKEISILSCGLVLMVILHLKVLIWIYLL